MSKPNLTPRALIETYREAQGLSDQRVAALAKQLTARIENGAVPALHISAPPPHLPGLLAKIWASMAVRGVMLGTLGASAIYLGVTGLSAPTEPATISNSPQASAVGKNGTSPPAAAEDPRVQPASAEPSIQRGQDADEATRAQSPGAASSVGSRERRHAPVGVAKPKVRAKLTPPTLAKPANDTVGDETIDAELGLLRAANLDLRQGHPERALERLAQADREIAVGKLDEARQLTRVLALCAAGKRSQAKALASSFIAASPHSPYVSRMRMACPD